MKLALVLALLLLIACEKSEKLGSSGPAVEIRVPMTRAEVGDVSTKIHDSTLQMTLDADGNKVTVELRQHQRQRREALSVDADGVITKARVTYVEDADTRKLGHKVDPLPSPVAGQTYLAWREGGKARITREDGSEPSAEELDEVMKNWDDVGLPDAMERIISSKLWKSGVRVAFTAAEIAEINAEHPDQDEKLEAFEQTLRSVENGVARFAVTMRMKADDGNGDFMKVTLHGEARVDMKTGTLLEIDGSGPIEGHASAPFKGTVTSRNVME
jgi:hypothetical protein